MNPISYRRHKRKSLFFKFIINLTGQRGAKVIPERIIINGISTHNIGS